MPAIALDHVTIVTRDLAASRDFYIALLGLEEADFRPKFSFDGAWLKLGETAVVHLIAENRGRALGTTLPFDHFAMRARNLAAMRKALNLRGLEFREQIVPGGRLRQIFVSDPDGVQVELTFDVAAETAAGSL